MACINTEIHESCWSWWFWNNLLVWGWRDAYEAVALSWTINCNDEDDNSYHSTFQTHLGGGVNGVQGWVPPTGLRGVWVGLARGPCGWEGEPRPGPGQGNFVTSGAGALAEEKILNPCCWATFFAWCTFSDFLSGGQGGAVFVDAPVLGFIW